MPKENKEIKELKEEELKKVSGGCIPDNDKEHYKNLANSNKIIHKIVREDGRNVEKGKVCDGYIKFKSGFHDKFYCEKCGEWYDASYRTAEEIFEEKFDVEIIE